MNNDARAQTIKSIWQISRAALCFNALNVAELIS